jgi:ferredoxin
VTAAQGLHSQELKLRVNPIACAGHGVCAELLPELISIDEWGYPLLATSRSPPTWPGKPAARSPTARP